ncbi:hypothetical protein NDU88_003106 [Pleurodeles waltl]|uniref:Uncharacterized protein n=1 Tax=Pleurodeles waltl TaxID=8319 RepID=A0AAV7UEZ6_PLEWA|nr:hypothetical protein NDU88_003106 [Pleurodeles waltl]
MRAAAEKKGCDESRGREKQTAAPTTARTKDATEARGMTPSVLDSFFPLPVNKQEKKAVTSKRPGGPKEEKIAALVAYVLGLRIPQQGFGDSKEIGHLCEFP